MPLCVSLLPSSEVSYPGPKAPGLWLPSGLGAPVLSPLLQTGLLALSGTYRGHCCLKGLFLCPETSLPGDLPGLPIPHSGDCSHVLS